MAFESIKTMNKLKKQIEHLKLKKECQWCKNLNQPYAEVRMYRHIEKSNDNQEFYHKFGSIFYCPYCGKELDQISN